MHDNTKRNRVRRPFHLELNNNFLCAVVSIFLNGRTIPTITEHWSSLLFVTFIFLMRRLGYILCHSCWTTIGRWGRNCLHRVRTVRTPRASIQNTHSHGEQFIYYTIYILHKYSLWLCECQIYCSAGKLLVWNKLLGCMWYMNIQHRPYVLEQHEWWIKYSFEYVSSTCLRIL